MELELRWVSAESLDAELAGDHARLAATIAAEVCEWPPLEGEWDRGAVTAVRALVDGASWDPQWGPAYVVRDGRLVASAGFMGPPDDAGEVEIGYSVCRSDRRQGVATAVVGQLCEIAADRGCRAVWAETSASNVASIATLLGSGFVRIGAVDGDTDDGGVRFQRPTG
jgi:RimJ/RimL family protein N-acetyltransferase